jgi:hypothetical protein
MPSSLAEARLGRSLAALQRELAEIQRDRPASPSTGDHLVALMEKKGIFDRLKSLLGLRQA